MHATCVASAGRALLIKGASGAGKSALALEMMARGAVLVADDRVTLRRVGTDLVADAVPAIAGLLEARGLGVLNATPAGATAVRAVIDLDHETRDRIPPARTTEVCGVNLPLFYGTKAPHLAASLIQLLRAGLSNR